MREKGYDRLFVGGHEAMRHECLEDKAIVRLDTGGGAGEVDCDRLLWEVMRQVKGHLKGVDGVEEQS